MDNDDEFEDDQFDKDEELDEPDDDTEPYVAETEESDDLEHDPELGARVKEDHDVNEDQFLEEDDK